MLYTVQQKPMAARHVKFHTHRRVPMIILIVPLVFLVFTGVNTVESSVNVAIETDNGEILDSEWQNMTRFVSSKASPLVYFICSGSQPVEWVFDGETREDIHVVLTERNLLTNVYAYKAQISFYVYKSASWSSDLFLCRSMQNTTNNMVLEVKPSNDSVGHFVATTQSPTYAGGEPSLLNYRVGLLQALANLTGEYGNPTSQKIHFKIASTEIGHFFQCQLDDGTFGWIMFKVCHSAASCANNYRGLKKVVHTVSEVTVVEIPTGDQWAPYKYNYPGIAVCVRNANTQGAVEFFFSNENRGENPKIEFSWHEIVPSELLWIEPLENVYFLSETISIACHIPNYGFSSHAILNVFVNDTKVDQVIKYDYLKSEVKLTLTVFPVECGAYMVKCVAPVWNTTEWANATRTFKVVQDLIPPYFIATREHHTLENSQNINLTLNCDALGIPHPSTFSWGLRQELLQGKTSRVLHLTPEILLHGTAEYADQYEFICNASNGLGQSSEKTFVISIVQVVEFRSVSSDEDVLSTTSGNWLEDVGAMLDMEGIESDTGSKSALHKITTNVEAGNYDGNDIKEIVDLVQKAEKLGRTGIQSEQEQSIRLSMQIFNEILSKGHVWNTLPKTKKAELGTVILNQTELILIEFSSRFAKEQANISTGYINISQGPHKGIAGTPALEDPASNSSLKLFYPTSKDKGFNISTFLAAESTKEATLASGSGGNSISLPAGWKYVVGNGRNLTISFVGTAIGSEVATNIFPTTSADGEDSSFVVNSAVLSFTVGQRPADHSDKDGVVIEKVQFPGKGVEIEFENRVAAREYCGNIIGTVMRSRDKTAKMDLDSAMCVFWDENHRHWSSEGCHRVTVTLFKTVCECNHLTAFSVLMKPFPHESEPDSSLDLLTLVLCRIGIVCLVISVFILSIVKLKTATLQMTSRLTIHLSICLAIAKLMLLLLFDQTRFQMDNWPCYLIGMFTHYILLVAFCFMALEGLHLYRLTVQVFPTNTSYAKWHFALAYLIPAIVVAVTAISGLAKGRQAYGNETLCWLNGYYLIGGFIVPAAILVGMNIILLSIALFQAANRKKQFAGASNRTRIHRNEADKTTLHKITESLFWVKSVIALSTLLGVTWIFGLLLLLCNQTVSLIAAYLFTILNASQGIFILFFHCIGNSNVRHEFLRKIRCWGILRGFNMLTGSTNSSPATFQQSQEMKMLS